MRLMLVLIHLGCLAAPWHCSPSALVLFLVTTFLTMLGTNLGYHRLLTHRSFQCHLWLERLLSLLGSFSMQGGPCVWTAVHRAHHKHSDGSGDPHNAARSKLWAYFGWLMYRISVRSQSDFRQRYCPELERDWFHRSLDRSYIVLNLFSFWCLWKLGGWSWVCWVGCLRIGYLFHMVGAINGLCHGWGYRNFETRDASTNLAWVAYLSIGEGWHNNHHAYPWSARSGLKDYEWDLGFVVLQKMESWGWVWNLKQPPREEVAAC
jgi:fatty-acid desaturase